ncbi:MAG: PqqD family protein [Ruminococcaceae bacterium]|nr:PqqD family protein [Oscillospiraceae bacterium]
MKRNEEFVLRELADKNVLIPFGKKALDFNGVITINDTAKFLWERSEDEIVPEKLADALVEEFGIDLNTANEAVKVFIEQLREAGCINE